MKYLSQLPVIRAKLELRRQITLAVRVQTPNNIPGETGNVLLLYEAVSAVAFYQNVQGQSFFK